MRGMFADTAGWMACADSADPAHRAATAARDAWLEQGGSFVTTDYIADETSTLILLSRRPSLLQEIFDLACLVITSDSDRKLPRNSQWLSLQRVGEASGDLVFHGNENQYSVGFEPMVVIPRWPHTRKANRTLNSEGIPHVFLRICVNVPKIFRRNFFEYPTRFLPFCYQADHSCCFCL